MSMKPNLSLFLRDVGTLASGTAAAQAIMLVSSPVLSRIYTPAEFGAFAAFMATVVIFASLSTGRFEIASLVPRLRAHAALLTLLAILCSLFFNLLLALALLFVGKTVIGVLDIAVLQKLIFVIPLSIFFMGCNLALHYLTIREDLYKTLSVSRILQSVTFVIGTISMGLLGLGAAGLIVGFVAAQFCRLSYLLYCSRQVVIKTCRRFTVTRLRVLAARFKDFPLFNAPAAMFASAGDQAPVFIIGLFYSVKQTGFYDMGQRAVNAPLGLVTASVADVLHRRMADALHSGGGLVSLVKTTSKSLLALGIIPALVLMLLGPALFGFVFGEQWTVAGQYASILAPAYLIRASVSPVSRIFSISGHVRRGASWRVIYFFTLVTTLTFAASLAVETFFVVYMVHELVLYAIYYSMALNCAKYPKRTVRKQKD